MNAAIVVLNYNDFETTEQFIQRVGNFTSVNHIVVVDNCSLDGSYDKLRSYASDKLVVLKTDENKGYAYGNNYGINYAVENYDVDNIFVANPDIILEDDTIKKILEASKSLEKVGQISCRMICKSGIELPEAWHIPTYMDCLMENLIILKKVLHYRIDYSTEQWDQTVEEVEVLPGSFFMITREAFDKIGGMDENTFLYYEENIMAILLKKNNYKNYLLTDLTYIHNHSVSINKTFKSVAKRLRIAYASREYYCTQYLDIGKAQKIILKITFEIGLFNYRIVKKILKRR